MATSPVRRHHHHAHPSDDLGELSSEKRDLNENIKRLQASLSDSALQERKAHQRVEKQQMMLHFHRTRAAIVSRQILKISGELKVQEQTAWDHCQDKRRDREHKGRERAGKPDHVPFRVTAASSSPGWWKPGGGQKLNPGSTSTDNAEVPISPPSSSSTADASGSAATWDFNYKDTRETPVRQARNGLASPPKRPWSKSHPSLRIGSAGSPPVSAGGRRDGMLQLGSRLKSTLPPKAESEGTTLLDWFESKETSWAKEGRPKMQVNQGGLSGSKTKSPLTAREKKQEAERQKKLRDELKAQRREEAEQQKVLEEERHAEEARQLERRLQAEQRELAQRRREAIRVALKKSAGDPWEAFAALDQNGSGRVSLNEFVGGMHSLCVPWEELTGLTKINEVFKLFDHDRKGFLDFVKLFPLEANQQVDPTRLSTPEYWKHFCKQSKDIRPEKHRGPTWDTGDPEQKLQSLETARNYREDQEEKKEWMRGMIHRLKHRGKGDARCREIVALHLPRGTGPNDMEGVPTISHTDVQDWKKGYMDKVQESVRNIEKVMYDLHEQRKSLHLSKQQLYQITEEPVQRQKALEESRASLMKLGGFADIFHGVKKEQHKEGADDGDE